jgi:hypothetical protein
MHWVEELSGWFCGGCFVAHEAPPPTRTMSRTAALDAVRALALSMDSYPAVEVKDAG